MKDKIERSLNRKLKSLQSVNQQDFEQAYQKVIDTLSVPELTKLLERFGWDKAEVNP